jgi:hypothetical protein
MGIVRANDILQLRLWLVEEENHERKSFDTKASTRNSPPMV